MDHAGTAARALTIESRWTASASRLLRGGAWSWLVVRVAAFGFAVAGLSCDPLPGDDLHTAVAVVNVTRQAVDVQIFRTSSKLNCQMVYPDPEATLTPQDFALDSCTTLPPFVISPLDIGAYTQTDYDPPPGIPSPRTCDAVILRAPGLEDTAIFWNELEQASIDVDDTVPLDSPNLAYLNNVGDYWFLLPPAVAKTWLADFVLPDADCDSLP